MPTAECNGLRIAYEDTGSGEPPFVFVHGWSCDRSAFAPQAEYFARNHRVVSLDLRGHGESDKPEGDYPIAAYSSDVGELVKQLNLRKPIVVGHSLGGSIALQLAADFADHVGAIVMVDAWITPSPEERQALESVMAGIEAGQKEPLENLITGAMFLPTSDPKLVEQVKTLMTSAPGNIAVAAAQGALDFNGSAVAAKCTVPALHITGAAPSNPAGMVTSQTVGAGHFPQLEVPEQVNLMIEAFLKHYVN